MHFIAYLHVDETQGIHKSLGYIHDTFKRMLPQDMDILVGWQEEHRSQVKYTTHIESRHDDYDRIVKAFRFIAQSFDPYIRLATLLCKKDKMSYKLVDLFEIEDYVTLDVNC